MFWFCPSSLLKSMASCSMTASPGLLPTRISWEWKCLIITSQKRWESLIPAQLFPVPPSLWDPTTAPSLWAPLSPERRWLWWLWRLPLLFPVFFFFFFFQCWGQTQDFTHARQMFFHTEQLYLRDFFHTGSQWACGVEAWRQGLELPVSSIVTELCHGFDPLI